MAPKRCVVTGVPLDPHGLVIRTMVPAYLSKPKYLQEANLVAAPVALHKHPYHGGTVAVGLDYSGKMHQFIGGIDDRDERRLEDWWRDRYGYGYRRVKARMIEKLGPAKALRVTRILYVMHRREATLEATAERYGLPFGRLWSLMIKAKKYSREA